MVWVLCKDLCAAVANRLASVLEAGFKKGRTKSRTQMKEQEITTGIFLPHEALIRDKSFDLI